MKRTLVFVVAIIAVAVGMYLLLKPKSPTEVKVELHTYNLVVKDHKLTQGPATLSVKQGDTVVINITADEADELHLHGYDQAVDLEKDKQSTLSVVASKTGNFPFELEHSGTELGNLQVSPR